MKRPRLFITNNVACPFQVGVAEITFMKALLVIVALATAVPALAQPVTTNPIRYTWIATSCADWNCAASAFMQAAGDKYVIVLPTTNQGRPWLILRRVEEGSIYIPEDEPYVSEVFDNLPDAVFRYDGITSCRGPMIMNVTDGRMVVTSLNECPKPKQRAVR